MSNLENHKLIQCQAKVSDLFVLFSPKCCFFFAPGGNFVPVYKHRESYKKKP